ncbi:AMIN-like domain-containing (lipo)protein [Cellulomonas soli]|uniref:AMIN-like domain-containing (lipo)protein n=1 Tax=Cellulomonas soli TaxID=931535 RepID=UPI003F864BA0
MRHPHPSSTLVVLATAALLAVTSCTSGDGAQPTPVGPSAAPSTSAGSAEPSQAPSGETPGAGEPLEPSPGSVGTSDPGSTDGDGSTSAPAFPADTAPDTGDAAGGPAGTLVDLRVGAHDGYDRVVLELDGPGTPGWTVRYVVQAVGDGSGEPVEVAGDAVLEVTLMPVALPTEGTNPYDGPRTIRAAGTTAVTEVVWSSLFEGYLQVFIGVDGGQRPFRAYALDDPARIVVDVRSS